MYKQLTKGQNVYYIVRTIEHFLQQFLGNYDDTFSNLTNGIYNTVQVCRPLAPFWAEKIQQLSSVFNES